MRHSLVFGVLAIALLTSACRTAMSVEEAKRVTAEFAGRSFVPPPRTINDITAILDQQTRADPEAVARARALVDQPPPATSDPDKLADFYHQRGLAARELGRLTQELEDLSRAADYARRMEILADLSSAHLYGGNINRSREIRQEMLGLRGPGLTAWQIHNHAFLARLYAIAGDLEAAEAATRESQNVLRESRDWQGMRADWIAGWKASVATARASVAEARGRYEQAEAFYRESISTLAADGKWSKESWLDLQIGRLAQVAVALNCALEEASTADAERQLHKLVWLLCARSGGDICGSVGTFKAGCNKTHQCLCGKVEGGGSLV
jgi:tetratricopeptide (TPR) repeat protein